MRTLRLLFVILITFVLSGCDFESREITLTLNKGYDQIDVGEDWVDPGVEASDGVKSDTIYSNTVFDTSIMGTYEVVYSHTEDGETYSIIRYVTVADMTPPLITLNPGVDTIFMGESWVDEGVEITDNVSPLLAYQTQGEVDTSVAGTYIITYSSTDDQGNTATLKRFVTVLEPN